MTDAHNPLHVVVVAAVVERANRLLVTRRPPGTHLAGYWEFPGGKAEPGESQHQCLKREMREELNLAVEVGAELLVTSFRYPDRTVELHFFQCATTGEPTPVLGQQVLWIPRTELKTLQFPAADLELINLLTSH